MLAVVAAWLDPAPPPVAGRARVADGDSFVLDDTRIRLLGLDAPELNQECSDAAGQPWPCGRAARDRLAALLGDSDIHCIPEDTDRFGRLLARCTSRGDDPGARMVAEGLALSSGGYWREEAEARAARKGIWAGNFERPADWRDDHPRGQGMLGWLGDWTPFR